jgi:hypothetical protein
MVDADKVDGQHASEFAGVVHDHLGESWSGSPTSGLTITTSGQQAITGTSTASSSPSYGVRGFSDATLGYGVYGVATETTSSNAGVYGKTLSTHLGYGVYGYASSTTGTTYGVYGKSDSEDGYGVRGDAKSTADGADGTGVLGWSDSPSGRGVAGHASSATEINFGVHGHSESTSGRGVYGVASAESGSTYGVYGVSDSTDGRGVYGLTNASGTNYGVHGKCTSADGAGVYAQHFLSNGTDLALEGNNGVIKATDQVSSKIDIYANGDIHLNLDANADQSANLEVYDDGSNVVFRVTEAGNVEADGTYTSPAADFAELLPGAAGLEPGDVLAVYGDGTLGVSAHPYESKVVGVYSTQPAFLGGKVEQPSPRHVPLAVVGIVPVKVCSEGGAITPGDLLVSSSIPGHAMRGRIDPPNGTVIGKALEGLVEDRGTIRMMVMLQ